MEIDKLKPREGYNTEALLRYCNDAIKRVNAMTQEEVLIECTKALICKQAAIEFFDLNFEYFRSKIKK